MLENTLEELDKMADIETHNHGKRKSLGRGLGALLGDDDLDLSDALGDVPAHASAHSTAHPVTPSDKVNINSIVPSPYQPRTEFDEEALKALAASIKEKGVLQPLLVRKTSDGYELIAGERRLRASKLAGLTEVPVIIKEMNDKEVLEVALVENLLRENLSAIEEAEGLQRLIDEFSHTQEALSQIIGKSRSHIANTLRLLSLPESVQNLIKEGKLSAGHARNLVGLDNAEELAQLIIKKDLNVRQVEELVNKIKSGTVSSKNAKPQKDDDIADLEKDLKKSLGLRISISPNKQGGGKVVLQYASVAELDMIIDILEQKRNNNTFQGLSAPVETENLTAVGNEKFTMKIID